MSARTWIAQAANARADRSSLASRLAEPEKDWYTIRFGGTVVAVKSAPRALSVAGTLNEDGHEATMTGPFDIADLPDEVGTYLMP